MNEAGELAEGRYHTLRELGQGGMGGVYCALDRATGQHVALKRLHARGGVGSSSSGKLLSLFEREYHTLAQLAHPRIIAVYDYGIDSIGPFYTMELLAGSSLHARERLPWRELCVLLHDVASALALVHSRRFVHRDVTPRNIQCLTDGRGKLIDFGAMSATGHEATVVGTPPFVPPEAMAGKPLDGRADLYALGATAYWALTGHHAYPARQVSELSSLWRTRPPALTSFDASIPAGLCELITSLLQLDAGARPASAAEVMERLAAIAGLQGDELSTVSASYWTTPNLVGRGKALRLARDAVLQALRGHGEAVVIAGEPGVGRSRLLDACVLEGKLLGVTVARVQAEPEQSAESLVSALDAQLRAALPEPGDLAGTPAAAELAHHAHADHDPRRFLETRSARAPLLLAIDDAQLTSDAARAWLCELGAALRTLRVVLFVTVSCERALGDDPRLSRLSRLGKQIRLQALDISESRALLASVFGEGPSLEPLVKRLHPLCQGRPRALMLLSQRLADERVLRYEEGSWLFPERFDVAEFAIALLDAPHVTLAALSHGARVLASALALCRELTLSTEELARLCGGVCAEQLSAAEHELVQAGILAAHTSQRPTFSLDAWAAALTRTCDETLRRSLHVRLGEVLLARGDERSSALYFLRGGDEARAFQLMIDQALARLTSEASVEESHTVRTEHVHAIADCLAYCRRAGRPARERYAMETTLVRADLGMRTTSRDSIDRVLLRLRLDCGLDDYWALPDTLDPASRLQEAFARATARHEATPEQERVFTRVEALNVLARVSLSLCSSCVASLDYALLQTVPSLAPFAVLSPALEFVHDAVLATLDVIAGRYVGARTRYERLLARLDQPDHAALTGATYHYARLGLVHGLGYIEACLGMASALDWADQVRDDPRFEVNALRIREVYHFVQGEIDEAAACRKRAELVQIARPPEQYYDGSSLVSEIFAFGHANDLLGMKRCMDRLQPFAQRYPQWRKIEACAVAEYERIRGDYAAALRALEQAIGSKTEGTHGAFILASTTRLRTLLAQGRDAEVLEEGLRSVAIATAERMVASPLEMCVALSEAKLGQHARAAARVDAALERMQAMGCTGLLLGSAFETRARIAILQGDAAGFEQHARLCAEHYARGQNAALHVRYQRLMTDAEQAAIMVPPNLAALGDAIPESIEQIALALGQLRTLSARAHCALGHVVQRSGVDEVFIYLVDRTPARLVASRGVAPSWLEARVRAHAARQVDDSTTLVVDHTVQSHSALATEGMADTEYRVIVLAHGSGGAPTATGAVVLHQPSMRGLSAVMEIVPLLSEALAEVTQVADRRSSG